MLIWTQERENHVGPRSSFLWETHWSPTAPWKLPARTSRVTSGSLIFLDKGQVIKQLAECSGQGFSEHGLPWGMVHSQRDRASRRSLEGSEIPEQRETWGISCTPLGEWDQFSNTNFLLNFKSVTPLGRWQSQGSGEASEAVSLSLSYSLRLTPPASLWPLGKSSYRIAPGLWEQQAGTSRSHLCRQVFPNKTSQTFR